MITTSVIIPARNEQYLERTIDSLLNNARGEIEVLVVLDGYWPHITIDDKRVKYIHKGKAEGMRPAINSAAAIAQGEYLLKTDAHCLFDQGYDVKLAADMKDNWIVVPRRHRLDAENWCIDNGGREPVDYMYLSSDLHGKIWNRPDLADKMIDDLMSAQGSCYFIKRDYFYELELLDDVSYGNFWSEFQEVGLKCWLSGGAVKVNKRTYYAHLHKKDRGYAMGGSQKQIASAQVEKWREFKAAWPKQTLPLESLIQKFGPVPTW